MGRRPLVAAVVVVLTGGLLMPPAGSAEAQTHCTFTSTIALTRQEEKRKGRIITHAKGRLGVVSSFIQIIDPLARTRFTREAEDVTSIGLPFSAQLHLSSTSIKLIKGRRESQRFSLGKD